MNIFDIYADVDTALWLQAETLGGSYTLRSVPSSPGRSTLTLKIINLDSLDSCSYLAHPVWISSWISSYHTIQGFVHTILLPYYILLDSESTRPNSWGWFKLHSSLRFPKVADTLLVQPYLLLLLCQHRLKIHFEKNSCQNLSQKVQNCQFYYALGASSKNAYLVSMN